MNVCSEVRSAYDELARILRVDASLSEDDALHCLMADIAIELDALAVTERRKDNGGPETHIVTIKAIELERRLADLAMDILGYYQLPMPTEGDNEPPPGNVYAPALQSNYLKAMRHDETKLMRLRDELAAFLASRKDGSR